MELLLWHSVQEVAVKVKASGDFNLSEDQLLDYGNSIAENETGIMFTTYDQKVIFQLSLPLTGMEDTAAESMMVESTRRFSGSWCVCCNYLFFLQYIFYKTDKEEKRKIHRSI